MYKYQFSLLWVVAIKLVSAKLLKFFVFEFGNNCSGHLGGRAVLRGLVLCDSHSDVSVASSVATRAWMCQRGCRTTASFRSDHFSTIGNERTTVLVTSSLVFKHHTLKHYKVILKLKDIFSSSVFAFCQL